jgi:predicted metal-binding protein
MLIDFNQLLMYNDFCTTYTDEQKINLVRQYRNALLMQSDFSQLEDSPVDKEAWAEYRQELRDFMVTYEPSNLTPIFPQIP